MATKEKKKDGVSLRTVYIWLIVGAVILCGLIFYSTYRLSTGFRHLTEISEQQIELRKSARELMDASDYLTEKVQRFALHGDPQFMDAYFSEAFEARHREEAVAKMFTISGSTDALQRLESAMSGSMQLMEREYYVMRLVIEAKGYTAYPDILKSVSLTEADRALSAADKMRRASEMVFDEEYYGQKDKIREDMRSCLDELEQMAYSEDASLLDTLHDELLLVRIVIVLQTVGGLFMVWLTSRLGIHPILNAVNRIKENNLIPEVGANEFRYLARAYNKMYEVYRKSLASLNFKASHDELTGVYNRAGYELLLSTLDLSSTYMILVDVDNFKSINDTYGHETGDRVLKKLVDALKNNFRSDDHICRIGGDEFVVFMVHAAEMQHELVAEKIERINRELEDAQDGLPPVSISVGITHGSDVSEAENMFKKTDEAMYRAKRKGKRTYTFSHP